MLRTAVLHQRQHFAGGRIRVKRQRRFGVSRTFLPETLPVLRIEIPRATGGFVGIHEHAMLAPQLAVEKLHP